MDLRFNRRAFTLIEVLVASAISGILLTSLVALLFTFTQVTSNLRRDNAPAKHSQMLERVILDAWRDASFSNPTASANTKNQDSNEQDDPSDSAPIDTLPDPSNNNSSSNDLSEPVAVSWDRPAQWNRFKDPLFTFTLSEPLALLDWQGQVTGSIRCHLYLKEKEGLYLVWRPSLLYAEPNDDSAALYQTLLSPFVVQITYWYYDEERERWESTTQPDQANDQSYPLPQSIELLLRFPSEEERNIFLTLPNELSIPLP